MGKISRPALDEADRRSIVLAIDVLLDKGYGNAQERFDLVDLQRRIRTPAKGRPFTATMENLSKLHYGEPLQTPKRVRVEIPARDKSSTAV